MEFPSLRDHNLEGKRILLRVDINSPIDPRSMEILDDLRIRGHLPTLQALEKSKVAIMAHQSRPGLEDFTTLEKHARRIEELSGRRVRYVDDIFGAAAREEISKLRDGEILVLENVRFCSEEVSDEVTSKPPREQAKTNFVRKLASYMEFFVNDAFAVSHRSQPSVVAFPTVLPSCAGLLMEKEVANLSRVIESTERPKVFSFGGTKAGDSISVIKSLLDRGIADAVLTSGLVANIFLAARGVEIGAENMETLAKKKLDGQISKARELLEKYGERIVLPMDLAFQGDEGREEAPLADLPNRKALDIGVETIAQYSKVVREARVVVANGPCGVFESAPFALGTEELVRSIAQSKAFSVIGGGHLSAIAGSLKVAKSVSYISTGGKATLSFLAGEKLPGIEALQESQRR